MAGRAQQPRARATVVALPREARGLVRVLPSGRSILVGLALLALAGAAYAAARQTSLFAVRRIEVSGGTPGLRADVRRELAPLQGTSLVALDGADLTRGVESLPAVLSASYDRAFPHTLRVAIVPETPAAVLHRGKETWLVSARGRVIARIPLGTFALLPRIWVRAATDVTAGAFLAPADGGTAAQALALAARFPFRIATAFLEHGELVFGLRSGVELRLGDPTDVRLKLAIARRALTRLPSGTTYLDVSVPGRPVAGGNPQVSTGG